MDTSTKSIEKNVLDSNAVRRDFPIFSQKKNQKLVYLDNAATTQRPKMVIDAITDFYTSYNSNSHRGAYKIAERSTAAYELARKKVAQFIGAESSEQIIFTRSTTEAINFIATGWARKNVKMGDEIIITELEHHSNLVPWQMIAREKGATLRFVEFDENGELKLDQFDELLSSKTKLVTVNHISNALGTINPIKSIIEKAHTTGAKVVIDGAQSVPHKQTDLKHLDADFFAFSGHKMYGPMGIGVLYGKRDLLNQMDPIHFGGNMISDVHHFSSTWNDIPWKFEAGTQNIPGAIGLGAAIDYIQQTGILNIKEHELRLTHYALERLKEANGIKIYGPDGDRGPVLSFTVENVHPHDIATFLDHKNIAVRAGHHCAKLVMKRLNVIATARASFALYNSFEDIDAFVAALLEAKGFFSKWN